MRVVIVGFDITAWLAAASAILRGHEVTLLATRGTDMRVVAAAQHPGQWLLTKTGDAARVLVEIEPTLADGDYKIPVGIHSDGKTVPLKDWLAETQVLDVLNYRHAARTGRTLNRTDAHFGVVERAIVSKSYIRHMSQDDAAAVLVRYVNTSAKVIHVTQWVVNPHDVWFVSNGSGSDVDFDLLVLADRAHGTEFGLSEAGWPCGVASGDPLECNMYEAVGMDLGPYLSVTSTDTQKIAIVTNNGSTDQIWTYGPENRDAVRRDVADGFGSPDTIIISAEHMFGGYAAEPFWRLPENMIAIGWQARGEEHSVDDAMREMHQRIGFEYEPLDEDDETDEDEDLILNEPEDDDDE